MTNPYARPVLALAAILLGACARTSPVDAPLGEPFASGPVESLDHRATGSRLLVRAGPGSRERCGIAATVDARTRYVQRTAEGALQPIPPSELAIGDTVEVYVRGPVAESCPPQAYAPVVVRVGAARP